MSGPTLSLIVPAKDQSRYLGDCLTSLTRQFDDPGALEVIMIDDGSTDGTGAIAEQFADRLPGLTVVRNESPVGLASARNIGLARATADCIGYLDGDDWLAPGHLAHLCHELDRLDVDFVRTDHIRSTQGQRELVRAPQARRGVALDPRGSILPMTTSTMVDYCYAWAGVFRRRVSHLLPFPDGLFTAEDRAWCWRLHLQASSFAVVDSPGLLYRRGVSSSLTQIVDRRQLDFLPSFDLVFDLVEEDPEAEIFWPKATRMFLGILAHHRQRAASMSPESNAIILRDSVPLLRRIPPALLVAAYDIASNERREALSLPVRRALRKA